MTVHFVQNRNKCYFIVNNFKESQFCNMIHLCNHTVYQGPCHSREQLKAGRQRGTAGGGTAAGNRLHLDQSYSPGEGSQGQH